MQENAFSDSMDKWECANQNLIFLRNAFMTQKDSLSSKLWQLQVKPYQKITFQQSLEETISIDIDNNNLFKLLKQIK